MVNYDYDQDDSATDRAIEKELAEKTAQILVSMSRGTATLSEDGLEDLMALPKQSKLPVETPGFKLGYQSLAAPASAPGTLRELATAKTAGLNPSNCDADLSTKILDAIVSKEQQLYEEDTIDEHGRPLTKSGNLQATDSSRGRALQTWFDEAIASVDRFVGHAVIDNESGKECFEAGPYKATTVPRNNTNSKRSSKRSPTPADTDIVYYFRKRKLAALDILAEAAEMVSGQGPMDYDLPPTDLIEMRFSMSKHS